jgi:alpha-L-fucosidase
MGMNDAKIREMAEKEVGDRAWEEFTVHDLIQLMNRAIAQDREEREKEIEVAVMNERGRILNNLGERHAGDVEDDPLRMLEEMGKKKDHWVELVSSTKGWAIKVLHREGENENRNTGLSAAIRAAYEEMKK